MPLKDPEARRAYHREYMRMWYQQNRAIHIARVNRVTRRARERNSRYIDEQKSCPCADCRVRYPPFLLDFDHVRGQKIAILAKLRSGRASLTRVAAEIAKCEVVCSNCHRLRTYLRRKGLEASRSEISARLGPGRISVMVF
jgi:hypothetical protein